MLFSAFALVELSSVIELLKGQWTNHLWSPSHPAKTKALNNVCIVLLLYVQDLIRTCLRDCITEHFLHFYRFLTNYTNSVVFVWGKGISSLYSQHDPKLGVIHALAV